MGGPSQHGPGNGPLEQYEVKLCYVSLKQLEFPSVLLRKDAVISSFNQSFPVPLNAGRLRCRNCFQTWKILTCKQRPAGLTDNVQRFNF